MLCAVSRPPDSEEGPIYVAMHLDGICLWVVAKEPCSHVAGTLCWMIQVQVVPSLSVRD